MSEDIQHNKILFAIITVICLTFIIIYALSIGIDGAMFGGLLTVIGLICGAIFGFSYGIKTAK